MTGQSFADFFRATTGFKPYDWQKHVAETGFPGLLPVPTGLGKTEGAVLAWSWRLLEGKKNDGGEKEPRHLVYCLPMRTLVRQTVDRLERYFKRYFQKLEPAIAVYQLMGGEIDEEWVERPEDFWVLVGTQDQLLSRALNRGYAMSRFQWPVQFGLLNNDCRWIIDEVQLMGPGLWTTAQLDWMRQKRFPTVFPCPTTWMSATIGSSFLETKDRKSGGLTIDSLPPNTIDGDQSPEIQRRRTARRRIEKWPPSAIVRKPGEKPDDAFWRAFSEEVEKKHLPGTLSLVICNTVEAARSIFESLSVGVGEKILLTSRFRRKDRDLQEKKLLEFEEKRKREQRERGGASGEIGKPLPNHPGLICVSTQVVEAGVDVSAHHLWSEIAPWPSVIQRLGRLNRDGRDPGAQAWFWECPRNPSKGKQEKVGPYDREDVERSKKLLEAVIALQTGGPLRFAEILKELALQHHEEFQNALQPRPEPLPRAFDVHSLFSTERDLHGGFTDVSSFVRGGDPDADLTVVWREWEGDGMRPPPSGDALKGPPLDPASEGCPVPFFRLRETLKETRKAAWIWEEEKDRWEKIQPGDLRPGMVVMLHRKAGGYSQRLGWTGEPRDQLQEVSPAGPGRSLGGDERTEMGSWVSLDVHLCDAKTQAEGLCQKLEIPDPLKEAVIPAAALHDLGKTHPQWQNALPGIPGVPTGTGRGPWAKCPYALEVEADGDGWEQQIENEVRALRPNALLLRKEPFSDHGKEGVRLCWAVDFRLKPEEIDRLCKSKGVRRARNLPFRPGMRHEAASALAMWHRYRAGSACYPALAVYLAAAHHGKVRTVFRSLTDAADDAFGVPAAPDAIGGKGQRWPLDFSVAKDGAEGQWTDRGFEIEDSGWTGLVADLLGPWREEDEASADVVPKDEPRTLGPFRLAYLEALVRVADWRASAHPSACTKLSEGLHGE